MELCPLTELADYGCLHSADGNTVTRCGNVRNVMMKACILCEMKCLSELLMPILFKKPVLLQIDNGTF